jgi:hypothetical protein
MNDNEFKIIKNIDETDHYRLVVGIVPGDKVPQYLIFNKEHDVLEFAHNVLAYVYEALRDLEGKLQEALAQHEVEHGTIGITVLEAKPN